MPNWKQRVGAILAEMGLSPVAAEEVRKEVRSFRKGYAEEHQIDLTSPTWQDPSKEPVETMAYTYFEHGLPRKGILPGKSRWTANGSAAQTGPPEYPIPEHEILKLLQKLIAHQNWNLDRAPKIIAYKEETSSSISGDSEQSYAVGPMRGRDPGVAQQRPLRCGTRSGLRSCGLHSDGGSTECSQVAPVARMRPSFGNLREPTDCWLPEIVDLISHEDQDAMTSELRDDSGLIRDDHHVLPEATPASIPADAENRQAFQSVLADQGPAFENGLENTNGTSHQQCPAEADNSSFQQRAQQSNSGQTTMVGPYQRPSKVIVLKWKQHKRRAIDEERPLFRSGRELPNAATVYQNESIDEGTKRRRLGNLDPTPALPRPDGSLDNNTSDVGSPIHNLARPAVDTNQSKLCQAATKPPDGGAESLSPKERLPASGSKAPSIPDKVGQQEQTDQGPANSKVGLQWLFWLLDPRQPGGRLTSWPGKNSGLQSVHYVFEKTTELLETDAYDGIQFLFKLNNQGGEVKFHVTKGASEEFQTMKDWAPKKLKEKMIETGKKATAIDITLRPVGLKEVHADQNAATTTATVEDQDLYGMEALFEERLGSS